MNQPPDGPTQPVESGLLAERYRLLDKVGEGGAAEVYRARDTRLDRLVAIKILRRQFVHDQSSRSRFINEARAAAGLAHPNIVDVYDFGEAPDGSMFIAMQFVEGQNLKSILQKRGRMTAEETISIVTQVCAALGAAHARGLIHRDVKPQNILVDRKGHARLGDFGIVKALSGPELTQTGMTFGTAAYLSPEQATGQPIGPASDVYGLGCVMYEMLSGTLPFTGDNPAVVAYKQVWEQPRPLHSLVPEVPPSLENVVMRCLQKDPRARYPSTEALAADLKSFGVSFNQPTLAVPIGQAVNNRPPVRTQSEISQQIPMAGNVPPVRAQTTGPVGNGQIQSAVPQPQNTRRVTAPHLQQSPQQRSLTQAGISPRRRNPLVWGILGGMVLIGLGLCAFATLGNNPLFSFFGPPATPTVPGVLPSPTPSPTNPPTPPTVTLTPTAVTPSPTPLLATETPTESPTETPTETPGVTPTPTDTLVPLQTATPVIQQPTQTPIVPQPGLFTPTPTPTPGNDGDDGITIPDSQFVGGYTNAGGYNGRSAQWVYGQGTSYSSMTASFSIDDPPKEGANLTFLGIDSEDEAKTPMRITINDEVIYEGFNPLPNDFTPGTGESNWGWAGWTIPEKLLKKNNTITITNLDPSDQINFPIFIMIDEVYIDWQE